MSSIIFENFITVKGLTTYDRLSLGYITVKTKPRLGECNTWFGCETETGVVRALVIFQDRPMFSHINRKVSARAFH